MARPRYSPRGTTELEKDAPVVRPNAEDQSAHVSEIVLRSDNKMVHDMTGDMLGARIGRRFKSVPMTIELKICFTGQYC